MAHAVDWKNRTRCNDIQNSNFGDTLTLYGWVDTVRDHGHLLFIHLRDVSGIAQVVFQPEKQDLYKHATELRSEFVVAIQGTLSERDEETKNPHIPTGNVEVVADTLTILSKSETPPFMVTEKDKFDDGASEFNVDEDIRLKYRYLDLRRQSMQQNIIKRSQLLKHVRDYLSRHDFHDIETPVLTKSTPEGARDYLVPSRTHEGKFFALPQSPQLFKQLLMVSGFERYYQITRCFRDEDLRPNRQPEFTQVDIEASFIDESFIFTHIETLITELFALEGKTLTTPFQRLTYAEAMSTYGSDRPDLRYDLTFVDVTEVLKGVDYKIFKGIIANNGLIKGFNIKGQSANLSKNVLQNEWAFKLVQQFGGKGMTWMRVVGDQLESNIVQFFTDDEQKALIKALNGEDGDVLIFVADTNHHLVHEVLGKLRSYIAEYCGIIDNSKICPLWVTDFPMFELKEGQLSAMHHPFTQPSVDVTTLSKDALANVTARAYDIVINGEEVGGGSIRIHDDATQQAVFKALGLSAEDIETKFGFFVQALNYGTPPHGGIALGVDRLVSMILDESSIREVIAFPKNRVAFCPLTEAPNAVDGDQLQELHIRLAQ